MQKKRNEIIMQSVVESYSYAVRIPPKYSVSEIVGYLKEKSSLMIFRHMQI